MYPLMVPGEVSRDTCSAFVLPSMSILGNVRRGGLVGEKMFPGITRPSFMDTPRRAARESGWEMADRLGTRSIRRGAAGAILEAGGSPAQLLGAGQGLSSANRFLLDFVVGATQATASILFEAPDIERPGREEPSEEKIPYGPRRSGFGKPAPRGPISAPLFVQGVGAYEQTLTSAPHFGAPFRAGDGRNGGSSSFQIGAKKDSPS